MMDYTDRFLRFLLRRISKRATLYTEMVTANTLGTPTNELERFLGRDDGETPVVLQLGGSDPEQLARGGDRGAVGLRRDQPELRVPERPRGGARLLRRRADARARARRRVLRGDRRRRGPGVPVSVKCRIGVAGDVEAALRPDDDEAYASLSAFVDAVAAGSGVRHFVVHARKAVLGGLSPEQNRKVPPLKPELVRRLAAEHAGIRFSLNGGLQTVGDCDLALRDGDLAGVMVGRAVVARPWHWATVDTALYGAASDAATSRRQVLEEYAAFANAEEARLGAARPAACCSRPPSTSSPASPSARSTAPPSTASPRTTPRRRSATSSSAPPTPPSAPTRSTRRPASCTTRTRRYVAADELARAGGEGGGARGGAGAGGARVILLDDNRGVPLAQSHTPAGSDTWRSSSNGDVGHVHAINLHLISTTTEMVEGLDRTGACGRRLPPGLGFHLLATAPGGGIEKQTRGARPPACGRRA